MEGQPALTLNLGLRYDLEFLRTIATQTGNVSPRGGFAWTPFASRKTVVRGSYGLFYDRIPLRPLANALLSADNTTNRGDSQPVQHQPFAHAGGRAGVSEHPQQPDASGGRPVQLQHHGPAHEERLLRAGQLRNRATTRRAQHAERGLSARARAASDHFRESERARVHGRRNQQRLPAQSDLRQRQPVFLAGRFPLRRPARFFCPAARRNGAATASPTPIRRRSTMSSEFFFSAPINNFNIWQDYGRSDDDQRRPPGFRRHGSLLDGHGASGDWERISHGFQLTAMLQYYSPLPFNITTGRQHHSGHRRPPHHQRRFHQSQRRIGVRFLSAWAPA